MLRYLIMHVRSGSRATRAACSGCTTVADQPSERPSLPVDSGMVPEVAWPPSDAGVHSLTTGTNLVTHIGIPPNGGLVALLVFALVMMGGCACFRKDGHDASIVAARQMSLKGIDSLQRGRWDDAETMFAQALRENPADERAHRLYAEVMWQQGRSATAIRHMKESVRLSGGDPNILVQLGEMHLGAGEADAAWDCATEAIEANNRLAAAWALRGDIYRRQNKWELALESYHRALDQQPHFPHVQLAAAEVYRAQDRPRRALSTLDSLVSQYRPQDIPQDVLYQQGLAYKELGRFQDAVASLTKASQQGEPHEDLLFHLAEAQHLSGNSANARLVIQSVLSRSPQHTAGLRLQESLDRQGKTMTAALKR